MIDYVGIHTLHGGLTEVMTIVRATEPRAVEAIGELQFSGERNTARNTLDISHYEPSKREVRRNNRFYRSRVGRMLRDRNAYVQWRDQPHHGLIGDGWMGGHKAAVSSGYRKPKAAPRKRANNESTFYCGPVVESWDEVEPPAVISTEPGEWDDPGALWDEDGWDWSDPYSWDDYDEGEYYGYVHPKWWDHETRAIAYYDQRHGWNIFDGSPV